MQIILFVRCLCGLAGQGIISGVDRTKTTWGWVYRRVNSAWEGLNHLLWPAVCISCRQNISETDNNLCKSCWGGLLECTGGDCCRCCGRDVSPYALIEGRCIECRNRDTYLDEIARAGVYAEPLNNMILGLKKGKTELDKLLGFMAKTALQASVFFDDIDYLVPVPLHWTRRLCRGYNQSLVLSKKLSHPCAKINTDLVRIRRTKFQPAMATVAARAKNVKGAFAVRRGHDFAGRNICLIDDIKTTGATLNECAKTLKQAGAARVFALVLVVAGQSIN